MRRYLCLLVLAVTACQPDAVTTSTGEVAEWEQRAQRVTIIRDDWGIPHIYGETDADAVFGLMYAQAEDDFNRVEVNFLNAMGRLAEAEGEGEIWRDLRMKLFIDPAELQELHDSAPEWLQELMDAWADGLNYYLHSHPEVTPKVLTRFEPWMALSFSEGSIGGDIERVSLAQLESFYEGRDGQPVAVGSGSQSAAQAGLIFPEEPTGSNGFAIARSNTVEGNTLFLINPHTSFFFRAEAHVVSEEGLNAYGALTWGQFFVYQGFNETAGWMHTSSGVDNIDEYLETVIEREDGMYYLHGDQERKMVEREVTVPYKTALGMDERTFTVYRTHHGPVVREVDGRWVSVALMEEPLAALTQSYLRTKASNYTEFLETMEFHTNSSNNTVFADAEGNIAYFHSNFIPRRDVRFDWSRPVDGSDPTTDWQGVHSIDESPNVLNPPNGWIQNTNNWPYSASGPHSPSREDYPAYVQRGGENARGIHAIMVLDGRTDFTLGSLLEAAYDSYLPAFEDMIPALTQAFDAATEGQRAPVAEQVALLRDWDLRFSVESAATSLAVFWGEALRGRGAGNVAEAGAAELLGALADASARLEADFGTWQTPWGEINRFQRLTGDITHPFDDAGPSIPVGFTSSRWGSLASFGARTHPGTKKWYGTSGNSFVAVVEFGPRLRARAITAGGQSGDPASPHFNDQAERYATGDLREVYFYRADVEANMEREYHPGAPGGS